MTDAPPIWTVLKFGGTSVASATCWRSIEQICRASLLANRRVLVVHSALATVSDLLEEGMRSAVDGEHEPIVQRIKAMHVELAEALHLSPSSLLATDFEDLERITANIRLAGAIHPQAWAQCMGLGELMATKLGAAFLQNQGLACHWRDARDLLIARTIEGVSEQSRFTSAVCDDAPDAELRQKLEQTPTGIVLTQGFIASDQAGKTVLLGRGGSDTSAALLAAKLQADRLEIWTDVPGMFSADPRRISSARLLKDLSFEEAQEIASMGAKVIHPRSFPPVRRANIPVHVRCTHTPDVTGTLISNSPKDTSPRVKAVTIQTGVTLVLMTTSAMWQVPGFLAKAFTAFAEHELSIDLITTSETSVTVSLDTLHPHQDEALDRLVTSLHSLCKVEIIKGCATVSLVGRGIRTILHKLTPTLELFREHPVRLLSQAANDLNLSVVVDEEQAPLLAARLHDLMIDVEADDLVFGAAWDEAVAPKPSQSTTPVWWQQKRPELLQLMDGKTSLYVYDLAAVDQALAALGGLQAISKCFYAMKANAHPQVLERVVHAGMGIECVSQGELAHVMHHFPELNIERLLFTPNFASKAEYKFALERGIRVTLDSLHPITHWPELFAGARLNLRVDPERSRGHHRHVHTAGHRAKFGVPASDVPEICRLAAEAGAIIDGLHAHAGSGILDPNHWTEVGKYLALSREYIPNLTHINLGGGLGVPERPGSPSLDMAALNTGLLALKQHCDGIDLWLEPGRYVVAEAGVLLSRVTQTKSKQQTRYIGLETGMNSLLRPALYSARHEIFNLSRLGEPLQPYPVTIVGPICESADILGVDRHLPKTSEGDIILIANAGAYGAVMGSNYNLRDPAKELAI
ncbi:MAG: bifunctional aspartate kinase/diaminopimelate decarboxylase [Robiginitomaculum sp.]|nr:bifunctional aspartate kinase/diaminopimelate decarboxylase [Robiginitomaculum sp.]